MKKFIHLLLLSCFTIIGIFAQTEATTAEGRKVILNEDGTWRYHNLETSSKIAVYSDCSDLVYNSLDKVTGQSYLEMETLLVSNGNGENGFGIKLWCTPIQGKKTIVFRITVIGDSKCISDDDRMYVLFRDGTRLDLENNGETNYNENLFFILKELGICMI